MSLAWYLYIARSAFGRMGEVPPCRKPSVISILKCISISIAISITEMCGQFYLNFDCLEYFNFNMACISIISISISILKTRFLATFIYSFMTNKLMVRNLMFAKLQLVFNLFIMIFNRYN
jgi:hypothetical protein